MHTPQSIGHITPRFRITPGTALTALGVLVAIAVTIMFLALTGTNHHTTVAIPATTSQAGASATPQTRYLGPRQQQAPISSHDAASAAVGDPVAHPTCLGASQRCLR
jgi:cell division septation protein DedD